MSHFEAISGSEVRDPHDLRGRVDRLNGKRDDRIAKLSRVEGTLQKVRTYLDIAPRVTSALELLNDQLFKRLLAQVESSLTIALQEVLGQPVRLRADLSFKHGASAVDFWIDRDGNEEDVYRGQGGSVANVLSVGLRMFALATLDPAEHRRFLMLDEQDCWLRPDLVPKLVKIIHRAAKELGFQVLVISHHDPALFESCADKIFTLVPVPGGAVRIEEYAKGPNSVDGE